MASKKTYIPRADAERIAAVLIKAIATRGVTAMVVGSIRRQRPVVGDIDILVVGEKKNTDEIKFSFPDLKITPIRLGERVKSFSFDIGSGKIQVDFFIVLPKELPFALMTYTGPAKYNIRIRMVAKERGLKLNQYGVYYQKSGRAAQKSSAIKTEKDLAEFLGVTYRLPTERDEK